MQSNEKEMSLYSGVVMMAIVSLSLFYPSFIDAQFERDEGSAEEVQKVNPLTPAAEATGTVLDNTVNKVLPFDVSTESQLVKNEKDCYHSCGVQRDQLLKKSANSMDRGFAWKQYKECKKQCPQEAAKKNEEQTRAPAGSVINQTKSRQ